ncbi:TonB-dependent siderophore receptor [Tsuneonella mangrovi]|uniref:TonB-dependent siderophore receptor n=1 Tax=Tsuneonella mangrovi TaxID=1982042 RepID=UPI000BA27027|nr:TonB-dependent siderophore receptor [Tsuneonella mangrovi]
MTLRTSANRIRSTLLVGIAAGAVIAVPAHAQEASDSSAPKTVKTTENGETTIVVVAKNFVPAAAVTATKSDIPLVETPQSVSVVSRDQIDLLNFTDAQQAVRYTAGVFGENYGPDLRFDFFTVRGFTPTQYIDGLAAPASTTISTVGLDLYAFQSLEVLKGPASVLYGSSPPGGIFNETSRRADSQFGGEFEVKGGTDNFKQVASTITGPVSDSVDVRLTGLYRDRDGNPDFTHAKRVMVAPTATFHLGADTQFTPLFYYQYDKVTGGTEGFLPVAGTLESNPNGQLSRKTNSANPDDVYERHQWGAGYNFEHSFGPAFKFVSNLRWSHYKEETPYGVYDSGGFVNTTDSTLANYYKTIYQSNFTYREQVEAFTTDNRIEAKLGSGPIESNFIAGIDYRNIHNVADYGFAGFNETIDLYNPIYVPVEPTLGYTTRYNHQRVKQTGIYAQDQLGIGGFKLLASGRYDWVDSSYLTPYTLVTDPETVNYESSHKFTYRVGATYVTASGIAPYVSYATSFLPQIGTDSNTGNPFEPSTGKQWEAGFKFDGRSLGPGVKIFATAALFDIKQTNVVSTNPSAGPVYGTASGEVEVKGGEFEFVARIHNQLSINGSISYSDSTVLKSNTAAEIGAPLPVTPEYKASLFADYTISKGTLGGLGFGAGVRYTSSSAGSLPGFYNPVVYYGQAATLFDAAVHYDTPSWRFAVNASNLFDKTYVARCSGPAGCVYGASREIIGTVTKKF